MMVGTPRHPLVLESPLGKDALLLVRMQGQEELARLFHFDLDVLAPKQMKFDFDQRLGQPAAEDSGDIWSDRGRETH